MVIGTVLATLASVAAAAGETTQATPFLPTGEIADAPSGFVAMCARVPDQCRSAAPVGPPPPAIPAIGCEFAQMAGGDLGRRPRASPIAFFSDCSWASPTQETGTATAAIAATVSVPRADRLRATDPLAKMIRAINRRVNRGVAQRTDAEAFGVDEFWSAAGRGRGAVGDCEDIALEKRAELQDAGLPAEQLRLATVYVSGAGLHTVLVVRLPGGDFVLDSRTSAIVRWDRARMVWLRIQDRDDPMAWRRIAPRSA